MTSDRLSNGYEPDWDIDYAVGRQGELWAARVAEAIRTGANVEIKTDEAAAKWGRIYLEYECLYADGYRRSGLATSPSELWATVLAGDVIVIAPTWRYKHAARKAWRRGLRRVLDRGSHPTRGVVVPLSNLLDWLMEAPPIADPAKPWENEAPRGDAA
jgi:hypothetical protein